MMLVQSGGRRAHLTSALDRRSATVLTTASSEPRPGGDLKGLRSGRHQRLFPIVALAISSARPSEARRAGTPYHPSTCGAGQS